MDNIILIGTSHVAQESKQRIKHSFSEFKPDIICIELDKQRFHALLTGEKGKLGISSIRQLGLTGYIFAVIGRALQKKIGNLVGMNPGEEMMLGASLAKQNNIILALIDQPVEITLRSLSKGVKFSEKMKMLWDMVTSPFQKKQRVQIDLSKVPSEQLVMQLLGQMSKRYPGFYRALVDDRNRHMAKKLFLIRKQHPEKKIMAIVGAGHVEGMQQYLKSLQDSN